MTVETEDGSLTAYSRRFSERYHSIAGAKSEALNKFVIPSFETGKLKNKKSVRVLDIGFGLGYNALQTVFYAEENNIVLSIDSLEKFEDALIDAKEVNRNEFILKMCNDKEFTSKLIEAKLYIEDARGFVSSVGNKYDVIYLDGFSSERNVELWTKDFFVALKNILFDSGLILTYRSAHPVVSGFLGAGLVVQAVEAFGRVSYSLVVSKHGNEGFRRLDEKREKERRETTGKLFYRDEKLSSSVDEIIERYKSEREEYIKNGGKTIKEYRREGD